MGFPGVPKPSDTTNYSGVINPGITSGTVQTGGLADLDTAQRHENVEVLQSVPPASFVTSQDRTVAKSARRHGAAVFIADQR
jgi:hypothetical protein